MHLLLKGRSWLHCFGTFAATSQLAATLCSRLGQLQSYMARWLPHMLWRLSSGSFDPASVLKRSAAPAAAALATFAEASRECLAVGRATNTTAAPTAQ